MVENNIIQIGVCDDHTLFRKGLVNLLSAHPGFEVVEDYESGEDLLNNLNNVNADVLLLDVNMDGRNGIEVLKQLRLTNPELAVIILSMNPPRLFGIRALKAGAMAYLHKDCSEEDLTAAIIEVSKGNRYITQKLNDQLLTVTKHGRSVKILDVLTDRELEILTKFANNYSNLQIGKELNISSKTVSVHKKNILSKLGVHNIMEAIRLLEI